MTRREMIRKAQNLVNCAAACDAGNGRLSDWQDAWKLIDEIAGDDGEVMRGFDWIKTEEDR